MSRLRALLDRPGLLRRTALAALVANVGIVIAGGAVRLTGSGLGCPSWPQCDEKSLVTTQALGYHGAVEFGNRTLTSVVGILAVAGLVLAVAQVSRRRDRITWAALVFAGIPAQILLGGATVRTHLNPWLVASHFLLSIAVIAAAFRFWVVTREPAGPVRPVVGAPLRALSWLLFGVTAAGLAAGAGVPASGPHPGEAPPPPTGLDPGTARPLHPRPAIAPARSLC